MPEQPSAPGEPPAERELREYITTGKSPYPNYRAHPDEHPLSETEDYDTRQGRYRALAYDAKHTLQLILEQPDALDDPMTRAHLAALRGELARLDLDRK